MRGVRPGRVGDILMALRGALEKAGWHGPSVLDLLHGVGDKAARTRPKGTAHSIHDLVEHIGFWEERVLSHVRPGDRKARRDWSTPARSFRKSVAHLRKVHASLVRAVGGLEDTDLERVVATGGGPMSLGRVLHGVAAHAAYHAGQIGLLKKRLL